MDEFDLNDDKFFGLSTRQLSSADVYVIFYTFVLPTFAAVGTILNISVVIIFSNRIFGSSCAYYFRAIALADTLFLVTRTLMYSPEYVFQFVHSRSSSHTSTIPLLFIRIYPVVEIAQILVTIYTLIIIMDHYIFEYKARNHLSWTGKSAAQKAVFTVLGVVVISHIPAMFKLQTRTINIDGVPKTDVCLSTMFLVNAVGTYTTYIDPILFQFIPGVLIVCFCVALVRKLILQMRHNGDVESLVGYRGGRSASTTLSIGTLRIVSMLPYLVITGFHILNEGPPGGQDKLLPCMHYTSDIKFGDLSPAWEVVLVMAGALNSSCKFFIYLGTNTQFQCLLCQCRTCGRRRSSKTPRYTPRPNHMMWSKVKVFQRMKVDRQPQPGTPSLSETENHAPKTSDYTEPVKREIDTEISANKPIPSRQEAIFFTKVNAQRATLNLWRERPYRSKATPGYHFGNNHVGSAPWADSFTM